MNVVMISVCIPTHNRCHLLRSALQSVFEQSLLPSQVIVSDDASTDITQSVVEDYEEKFRSQGVLFEYWRHTAPLGQEPNRRFALSCCSNGLVAMLDDDDMWMPTFLEEASSALVNRASAAFVSTGVYVIDARGRIDYAATSKTDVASGRERLPAGVYHDWLSLHLSYQTFFLTGTLFRRSELAAIGFVPEGSQDVCDFALFCALAIRGASAIWLPKHLGCYRSHQWGRASDDALRVLRMRFDWSYAMSQNCSGAMAEQFCLDSMSSHRALILVCAGDRPRLAVGEVWRFVRRWGIVHLSLRFMASMVRLMCVSWVTKGRTVASGKAE